MKVSRAFGSLWSSYIRCCIYASFRFDGKRLGMRLAVVIAACVCPQIGGSNRPMRWGLSFLVVSCARACSRTFAPCVVARTSVKPERTHCRDLTFSKSNTTSTRTRTILACVVSSLHTSSHVFNVFFACFRFVSFCRLTGKSISGKQPLSARSCPSMKQRSEGKRTTPTTRPPLCKPLTYRSRESWRIWRSEKRL